ncbi:hypothetical protein NQ315_000232 [Exocentrus adspersus]|uniref:Fatty acid synthase n=1 Tax=Exocentrus adspersus TaxID=1586481 RepID=A0AAV8VQM6_9CUCU|nr:hypothetical protein NQ315_000232 [Exocentrus adspersus]
MNEEIVISGISGRYPECNNFDEFAEGLLSGVDLVTSENGRFPVGYLGIPARIGKLPEVDKFDAKFFNFSDKEAEFTDPRQRILLETVQECIIDAGYNHRELRGSNTGVYVGIGSFGNPSSVRERGDTNGYMNLGYSLGMAANRISYMYDFKGKSYTVETACSSSMYAFVNAMEDLRSGRVDAAVVGCCNMVIHPHESYEFYRLNMLAEDGKCKVYSKLRDGYCRAESIISMLLQKKNVSRRVYATVVGAVSNTDGYKTEGITYPSAQMQKELMSAVYQQPGVDAAQVTYVEAHGTGTPVGDAQELQAIVETLCQNRKTPLLVGAVKSNMGHSEVSSGLCSISKALLVMETGIIPANLHTDPLDTELPGIKDGKIKVVTENLPWHGGLIGVNSFGFGGANAHVAFKPNPKQKPDSLQRLDYRLVQLSGSTAEAVNHFLDAAQKNRHDEDFLALVDEIHKMNCDGHDYRGYAVLSDKSCSREIGSYTKNRPVWWVYTGLGATWPGMGRDIYQNDVVRNSVKRCADILKPYKVNLENILTNSTPSTFEDPINYCCGIVATQIALSDLLHALGVVPDGTVGYSLGEIAASYAQGRTTLEEAVLLAYATGYALKRAKLPPGATAVVHASKEECLKLLPSDIYVASENGKRNVTVSGPENSINAFLKQLHQHGVATEKINTAGVAYHSKYVPELHGVVKKWVSTPFSEQFTRNLSNVVRFNKTVPENAIVVEISPRPVLEDALNEELAPSVTVLSLTNHNAVNNEQHLLSAIGKLYIAGAQPNLKALYNTVTYPVSRGTPNLASLVKWDHTTSWFTPIWKHKDYYGEIINVNISDKQHAFLNGHNIDGTVWMPLTGYLDLVWRTFAKLQLKEQDKLPVVMENVRFKARTPLQAKESQFLVNIMNQSGKFEVFEGDRVVCTGIIYTAKDVAVAYRNANRPETGTENHLRLSQKDFYLELRQRGYQYRGCFRGIVESDVQGTRGRILWQGNFPSFMDSMLHLPIISRTGRELLLPNAVERIVVDPQEHLKQVNGEGADVAPFAGKTNSNPTLFSDLEIFYNKNMNVIKAGSVEISGLELGKVQKRTPIQKLVLEPYEFRPYSDTYHDDSLSVAVQVILQNLDGVTKSLKVCEFPEENCKSLIEKLKEVVALQPNVAETRYTTYKDSVENSNLVVLTENLLKNVDLKSLTQTLNEDASILYQGDINKVKIENLNVVYGSGTGVYILRRNTEPPTKQSVVQVTNSTLQEIEELKRTNAEETVYLVSRNEEDVTGLMKHLGPKLKCVLIQDSDAPAFSVQDEFYKRQLERNLTVNVLRRGEWGTLIHKFLEPLQKRNVKDASVRVTVPGVLSTLDWVERSPNYIRPDPKSEKVQVHYSSLNSKDGLIATGVFQSETPTTIGVEYAGVTESGTRVMGLVPGEALSLQLQTDPGFTWEVPKKWSLQDAATVPYAYATSYMALVVRGRIQPGDAVLIHSGTGAVGLVAISIALSVGCEVYTTVGDEKQKAYLKKLYPQLLEKNIAYPGSFRKTVMQNTRGKGVDIILNSSSGKLFQQSLRCIGNKGSFLEIGSLNYLNNEQIDSKMFLKNSSFYGVSIEGLLGKNSRIKDRIKQLVSEGIKSGTVKPLPRTVFDADEVEDAFRFLSSKPQTGKVVVELRKEAPTTSGKQIKAVPKVYFHPNKTYIVLNGLEVLGLELADWLIRNGAKKIVLNSKQPIRNGYQSYNLSRWRICKQVTVEVNTEAAATLQGTKKLVAFARSFGPIGGVFNLAVETETARHLDEVTRSECPDLEHFVFFSSTALEELCRNRKNQNLPALAVQWNTRKDEATTTTNKVVAEDVDSCLEALERFMLQNSAVGSRLELREGTANESITN